MLMSVKSDKRKVKSTEREASPQIESRDLADGEMLESVDPSEIGSPLKASDPKRNIIFVGDGEPPTALHGTFRCTLPDAETQKAGFYHEDARRIIQHFPKKYKRFQKLGDV